MKKIVLIVTFASLSVASGCMLESLEETGKQCPPAGVEGQLSYIQTPLCTKDACDLGSFDYNFEYNVCPVGFSECAQDSKGLYYCTKFECGMGKHISNSECVEDDLENCGQDGFVCKDNVIGWLEGECVRGYCVATKCESGYDLKDDKCRAMRDCPEGQHFFAGECEDDDEFNCGSHKRACATNIGWISGTCQAGECVASECEATYTNENGICSPRMDCEESNSHLYNHKCELDTVENCGDHNSQCRFLIDGWADGKCVDKVCVPSACQVGFHIDSNAGICVKDTSAACGADAHACVGEQVCTGGECRDDCGVGEYLCKSEGGTTCADPGSSAMFCGADPTCTSFATCDGNQKCESGVCVQKSCDSSKTLCPVDGKNQCIDIHGNDNHHCGACNSACSDQHQAHASSNVCLDGRCAFMCDEGYEDCNDDKFEPVCVLKETFKTDPNNCGGCNIKCDSTDELCSDGLCVKSKCSNKCLVDGACVNTDTQCGAGCLNCNDYDNAAAGKCDSGVCTSTDCDAGFHLNSGKCVLNQSTSCAPHNASSVTDCTKADHAAAGYCDDNGECVSTACTSGYHVHGGRCEVDKETACGATGVDCTALDGWKTGSCVNGACVATTCQTNYCLNGSTCVDGRRSSSTCGTSGNQCSVCASNYTCQSGTCKMSTCATTLCLYNGDCISTDEHCGYDCVDCTSRPHVASGHCNTSAGACVIDTCSSGYHISSGICEEDSPTKCGSLTNDCTKLPGWSAGNCVSGACVATSCNAKTHYLDGGTCKNNDTNNCGTKGYVCSSHIKGWSSGTCSQGVCTVSSCQNNYHKNGSSCELDSNSNCGSHGNACAYGETCQNKVCKLDCTTDPGYAKIMVNGTPTKMACISSVTDFLAFRDAINAGQNWPSDNTSHNYILANEIDLGTQSSWKPVGSSSFGYFLFEGNNKYIKGKLTCASGLCGLFGNIGYGTINNLPLKIDVTATSCDGVGSLVGTSYNSSYSSCSNQGTVRGKNNVGGLVGNMNGGSMTNASVSGGVYGNEKNTGGLVGNAIGVTIRDSNYEGSMGGTDIVGGIVGEATNNSMLNRVYTRGTVGCDSTCGGIAGSIGTNTSIKGAIAFNSVAQGSVIGGIVGQISKDAINTSVTYCGQIATLGGVTQAGLIGIANNTTASTNVIACNWLSPKFSGSSGKYYAVINDYYASLFKQTGPIYVWKDSSDAASSTSNSSGTFLYSGNIAYYNNAYLMYGLNQYCKESNDHDTWRMMACPITSGPVTASSSEDYVIAVPWSETIPRCH